jgi:hypothetical protein
MKRIVFSLLAMIVAVVTSAQDRVVMFDLFRGQESSVVEKYRGFVEQTQGAYLVTNDKELTSDMLKNVSTLIITTPLRPQETPITFTSIERVAIVEFVQNGGRLLLFCEEDARTPLETYGANDIVTPFGLKYGENCPVRRNVGAITLTGEICEAPREVPYSGGRVLTGGIPLSIVNDEGVYQHGAYTKLDNGSKIVAFGDGMFGLLMGLPQGEGIRLSGATKGDPTKWWGKDSHIFMQEIITWLLK